MTYQEAMRHAGAAYLCNLIKKHGGNVRQAAREADLNRQDLYKKIRRFGLSIDQIRHGDEGNDAWRSLAA